MLERAAAVAFLFLVAALPWSIAPMSIGVALCGALTLAVWLREPEGLCRFRSPVTLPALGWLGALALATLTSLDPAGSAPRMTKALLFALVPVAAYHARDTRWARRATAVLLVSAVAATLFALGKFLAQGPWFPNRVRGAVGHGLTYGGQAMLLASLALGFVVRVRARGIRAIATGLLLLLLPALVFSFTRSAWLGFLLAAGWILATWRARWLAALVLAALVLAALLPGVYRERVLSIANPESPWNVERVHMWRAGARLFRDHPLTGVGLQDLHPLYERYKDRGAKERVGHLHSVWVQVAATMGAVGLATLVWLLAGLARSAAGGLGASLRAPPAGDGFDLALRVGAAAGLAGFLLAGLFEWNLGDEELVDLLCVLVGMALAASRRSRPPDSSSR
ncbi:MAG TPA: O-antigen ligase family protein [Candidatus Eisenbacteria bacterium]|jgi:O-antigen ligase